METAGRPLTLLQHSEIRWTYSRSREKAAPWAAGAARLVGAVNAGRVSPHLPLLSPRRTQARPHGPCQLHETAYPHRHPLPRHPRPSQTVSSPHPYTNKFFLLLIATTATTATPLATTVISTLRPAATGSRTRIFHPLRPCPNQTLQAWASKSRSNTYLRHPHPLLRWNHLRRWACRPRLLPHPLRLHQTAFLMVRGSPMATLIRISRYELIFILF